MLQIAMQILSINCSGKKLGLWCFVNVSNTFLVIHLSKEIVQSISKTKMNVNYTHNTAKQNRPMSELTTTKK